MYMSFVGNPQDTPPKTKIFFSITPAEYPMAEGILPEYFTLSQRLLSVI